jgi:hypothetical protein
LQQKATQAILSFFFLRDINLDGMIAPLDDIVDGARK